MSDASRVKLRWCLVGGELRDVADFADVPAPLRPAAICPVCRNPVVMKLGAARASHCAHRPADDCVLKRGETALHFNTKMYLYRQLSKGGALTVIESCAGVPEIADCAETHARVWLEDWDAVEVELCLESRRPDLVLLKGGQVVGAVEIFVTHKVDAAKAADLRDRGIPWVEVKATPGLYEKNWTAEQPLTVFRLEPVEDWRCDCCATQVRWIEAEAARKRAAVRWNTEKASATKKRREFLSRHNAKIRQVKIVDCQYPDGRIEREEFYIIEWTDGAQPLSRLEVDNPTTAVIETAATSVGAIARLKSACEDHLRLKSEHTSNIILIADWDTFERAKSREALAR